MRKYNIIAVFSKDRDRVLMCRRLKEPYSGLYNFVGGKVEEGENGEDAAYRELREETGIMQGDIDITHVMDFRYYVYDECLLEVYTGTLERDIDVSGDENELCWVEIDEDFFDKRFAGEGNIGHIMEIIRQLRNA